MRLLFVVIGVAGALAPSPMSGNLKFVTADFQNAEHADAVVNLLSQAALDPMNGGGGLPQFAKDNLAQEIAKRPTIHCILAFAEDDAPAGIAVCVEGFSTFACAPLLNIHDMFVRDDHRRKGIAKRLLESAENLAKEKGCCKLTLEVLENNGPAQDAYRKAGYKGYELDPKNGRAMFWEKKIAA